MNLPADAQLQRIERMALIWCGGTAVLGGLGDGWAAALSVLAGGLPVAVSYWVIRAGVDGAVRAALEDHPGTWRRSQAWQFLVFAMRFAILAFVAYVMMVRLRARPWWMLAGAMSLMGAAAVEAARRFRAEP